MTRTIVRSCRARTWMLAGSGVRWTTEPPIAAELTSASRLDRYATSPSTSAAAPITRCADVDIDRATDFSVEGETREATGEVAVDPSRPSGQGVPS